MSRTEILIALVHLSKQATELDPVTGATIYRLCAQRGKLGLWLPYFSSRQCLFVEDYAALDALLPGLFSFPYARLHHSARIRILYLMAMSGPRKIAM